MIQGFFRKSRMLWSILFFIIFIYVEFSYSSDNLNGAFLNAAENRNYRVMEDLIQKGADVNSTYIKGKLTALTSAAASGDIKLVNFLLRKGADVGGVSGFPNSPIYFAIENNHCKVVDILLRNGVDPNYAWDDANGGTLLTIAAQSNKLEIVKLLVHYGADVNYTGRGCYTALYRSIIYKHFDVTNFLLAQGARLSQYDKSALEEIDFFKSPENRKYLFLLEERKDE